MSIPVFILSWNRGVYLWACLDSVGRCTRYPARFILADNASTDPVVDSVISGFERRGLFSTVYRCADNDPDRLKWMLDRHRHELPEYYAFIESDIQILPSSPCWLETMKELMDANPKLGMLGSLIDGSDFIALEDAKRLAPAVDDGTLRNIIKHASPERHLQPEYDAPLIRPFNPPGRLLLMRAATIQDIPIERDGTWDKTLRSAGWETGIATAVRHRHLSLLNLYDYPEYDAVERERFHSLSGKRELSALADHNGSQSETEGALGTDPA
jgi:hypothetical protein